MVKPISENDDIRWSFNGRRLDKGDKYNIESNGYKSKLIIKSISLEDEGTYAVEINNSKSSAHLIVEGKLFNFFLKYFY